MKITLPFVITIDRLLGSGGAYVGKILAKKMNIHYADREIISDAAKELGTSEDELSLHDEKIDSIWASYIESYGSFAPETYTPPIFVPTDHQLFEVESKIIARIAKEHSSVVVGRCATHVLRDHPHHISLFLHSGIAFRKKRVHKIYRVSEQEAEQMIIKSDKERMKYFHSITGNKIWDARQYTLSIGTDRIGLLEVVELVLKYIEISRSRNI